MTFFVVSLWIDVPRDAFTVHTRFDLVPTDTHFEREPLIGFHPAGLGINILQPVPGNVPPIAPVFQPATSGRPACIWASYPGSPSGPGFS